MKRFLLTAALVLAFAAGAGCSAPKAQPLSSDKASGQAAEATDALPPVPQAKPVVFDKVPAGGFTLEALQEATFDVPAWNDSAFDSTKQCQSGRLAFAGQIHDGNHETYRALSVSYADINQDGTFETIALLFCHPVGAGEAGPEQVVALRQGQNNAIETLGQVVSTSNGISQLGAVAGLSDGSVRMEVRNRALCCAAPYMYTQHQLRAYAWDGKGFHQVAGTRAFYADSTATDLAIEVRDVVFGKPVDGVRTAKVTVTVHNNGPAETEQTVLGVLLNEASMALAGAETLGAYGSTWHLLPVGGQKVNEDRRYEFTVVTRSAKPQLVGIEVMAISAKANGDHLSDTDTSNNGFDDGTPIIVTFS